MINVLNLFDGISCGRVALERAGIPVKRYYASEIDKYAITVAQKNYPDTVQLGSVVDLRGWMFPKIDLLMAGSPCFTAGNLVLTSKGYVSIEEVKIGDMVLSHTGVFRKVLKVGSEIKPTLKINAQGFLDTVTTDNHPYYVRKMTRKWVNEIRSSKRFFSDPEWVNAGKIEFNDFLATPIIPISENPLNLSFDDCWLIGRYLADGHLRNETRKEKGRTGHYYSIVLSIGENKVSFFKERYKSTYSLYPHTKSTFRAVIHSKRLVEIIKNIGCGRSASTKNIPIELLNLPVDYLKNVLDGYLSGDGSHRKNEHRATTVSRTLVLSLSLAIAKVYRVNTNVDFTERPDTTVIEGRRVSQKNTYSISFRPVMSKGSNSFVDPSFIWTRFNKSNLTGLCERVYNLEVETDNSYTVNNAVVHNCQDFSFAGKQKGFNGERGKLFFEFVRVLKELKKRNPDIKFLLENTLMKRQTIDYITELLEVNPIFINSALVSAQSRKRLYWTNIEGVTQPEDKGIFIENILEYPVDIPVIKSHGELIYKPLKSQCLDANYWKGADNHGQRTGCIQVGEAFINGHDFLKRVYGVAGKSPTLTAVQGGNQERKIAVDASHWRKLALVECERLQTLPDNYTSGISDSRRYHAIGNGWTVDVIAHILSFYK